MTEERDTLKVVDALRTSEAWLSRWASHVGNCEGGDRCTCGLTRVRFEAEIALQEIDHPTDTLTDSGADVERMQDARARGEASIAKGVMPDYCDGVELFKALAWKNRDAILAALRSTPNERQ